MSEMAKTTSDSILMVIRKESWILDHFEIFVPQYFDWLLTDVYEIKDTC